MCEGRTRSYGDLTAVEMFPGVVRRTLVSGERLTFVEIRLAPGAEVPEHTHPHEQAGHVAGNLAVARARRGFASKVGTDGLASSVCSSPSGVSSGGIPSSGA